MMQKLEARFEEIRRSGEGDRVSFDDIDISQNSLELAQHDALFQLLGRAYVRVQRLRPFGSPGLDDAAIGLLANLLRRVSAASAPTELHLSDCAFGNASLRAFFHAIAANDAFPAQVGGAPFLLYTCLEGNFVDEQELAIATTRPRAGPGPPSAKERLHVLGRKR